MNSLGAILEQFPDEVIIYITDPRTGMQRRSKWPPTIDEILETCEQHQDYLERIRKPRPAPVPRIEQRRPLDPGALAQVFVPEGHSRYAGLVTWSKTADPVWWKFGLSSDQRRGIWVSHDAWNSRNNVSRETA